MKILFAIALLFLLIGCKTDKVYNAYLDVSSYPPNIKCFQRSQLLYSKLRIVGIPKEKIDIVWGTHEGNRHFWVECEGRLFDPSILSTDSGFPAEQYLDYKEIHRFKGSYDLIPRRK